MRTVLALLIFFNFCFAMPAVAEESNPNEDDPEEELIDATKATLMSPFIEIINCPMGSKGENSVRLLRRLDYYESGYLYYSQYDGEAPIGFGHDPSDDALFVSDPRFVESQYSRSWMELSCQKIPSSKEHVLILYIEPHAGRLMDPVVIRYNSHFKKWQELGLTSEEAPLYVYLNDTDLIFVGKNPIPERKNADDIYSSTQIIKGKEELSRALKKLPDSTKYKRIRYKAQIELNGMDQPKYLDKTKDKQ